jgi:hypothetical protein
MQIWHTYPLTVNQIRVERIGLLRWLLLSFSGKAAWTAFTTAVSTVMIYPAQQAAKGHSTSSPHGTQILDRELQYLSKILRRNILYQRMGGPLLEMNQSQIEPKLTGKRGDSQTSHGTMFGTMKLRSRDCWKTLR